jgi:hypothetical protein
VGNWAEDEYLQALKTQEHFAKESVGMLTSQMLSSTLNSALAPVTLAPAPADGALKFGDTIMCASPLSPRSKTLLPVLSPPLPPTPPPLLSLAQPPRMRHSRTTRAIGSWLAG